MPTPSQPAQPALLVEQWFDAWRWAGTLGWETVETWLGLRAPQQVRSRWLAEARQTTSDYLRSAAFLQLMRVNLSTMTASSRLISPLRIH
jgi:hypothetical protein